MRVALTVTLTGEQRRTLEQWARTRSFPDRQGERARVVLLAAAGQQDVEIAAELGISNQKAARWRKRFLAAGLPGLERDAPRPGRPRTIPGATVRRVVRLARQKKPGKAMPWSTRTMAVEVGISAASVRRIWRAHGLQPHKREKAKKRLSSGSLKREFAG